jgi:hypothetical protein
MAHNNPVEDVTELEQVRWCETSLELGDLQKRTEDSALLHEVDSTMRWTWNGD